jgi:hypothetical protein
VEIEIKWTKFAVSKTKEIFDYYNEKVGSATAEKIVEYLGSILKFVSLARINWHSIFLTHF